jgi:RNA polymerase-binding transcription factor DksA
MANKKDNKKKKPAGKSAPKKAAKPAARKAAKPAKKAAPKKAKPVAKKAAKPAKKTKPVAKKAAVKNKSQKTAKTEVKKNVKEAKKPAKDLKSKKVVAALSKEESKKAKPVAGDLEGEELDVEALELEPVEGAVADDDDDILDEEEEKPKRGRGRRPKGRKEGKKHYDSEDFVRKQVVKIDLSRPLIKKPKKEEPAPYVNNKDKRSRYSDKELAEFKEIILTKLNEAKVDYELLKQTLTNADNHGTDDTSPTFKLLEDGSDMLSKEEVAQLAARQEKYIVNLQNALVRIQNKTYGICRVTGKLIPKERLRSVPHATLSIDAKLSQYN